MMNWMRSLYSDTVIWLFMGMKTLVSGVYSLGQPSIIYGTKKIERILEYFYLS